MKARVAALTGVLVLSFAATSCSGQDSSPDEESEPAAHFEGETIEIVVTTGVGGGTDAAARYLGELIADELPGSPDVQVVNQEGGNHIPGMEEYASREPSALSLLVSSGSGHLPPLLGMDVNYSFEEWEPLVVTQGGQLMLAGTHAGIESTRDAVESDSALFFGGGGPIGTDTARMLGLEVLDVPFEANFGFSGGEERVALEQEEVDLMTMTTPLYLGEGGDLVDRGVAHPIYANGLLENGEIVRDPGAPDIPTIVEVYEEINGEPPSGDAWDAFKALVGPTIAYNNIMWIHQDAPDDARAALHDAVDSVVSEPGFGADSENILGPYEVIHGEEAVEGIEAAFDIEPRVTEWLSDWLFERFGVRPE